MVKFEKKNSNYRGLYGIWPINYTNTWSTFSSCNWLMMLMIDLLWWRWSEGSLCVVIKRDIFNWFKGPGDTSIKWQLLCPSNELHYMYRDLLVNSEERQGQNGPFLYVSWSWYIFFVVYANLTIIILLFNHFFKQIFLYSNVIDFLFFTVIDKSHKTKGLGF